jgi:Zn-dependent peptidase ImmA (M78 family)
MRFKLPKQVILEREDGRRYIQIVVKKMRPGYEDCDGVYFYSERTIEINCDLSPNEQLLTLIHEYMHAINHSKRFAKSPRTEHKIIRTVESPLFDLMNAVMRANLRKK